MLWRCFGEFRNEFLLRPHSVQNTKRFPQVLLPSLDLSQVSLLKPILNPLQLTHIL